MGSTKADEPESTGQHVENQEEQLVQCPNLRIGKEHSPYLPLHGVASSATRQVLIDVLIAQSEARTLGELNDRLAIVQRQIESGLIKNVQDGGGAIWWKGHSVDPSEETAFALFLALPDEGCSSYPNHVLYSSLSLFFLCEAGKADQGSNPEDSSRLVEQAFLASCFSFGEGARVVEDLRHKKEISQLQSKRAKASRNNEESRKRMFAEADRLMAKGMSKNQIAKKLAPKRWCFFGEKRIRDLLKGRLPPGGVPGQAAGIPCEKHADDPVGPKLNEEAQK